MRGTWRGFLCVCMCVMWKRGRGDRGQGESPQLPVDTTGQIWHPTMMNGNLQTRQSHNPQIQPPTHDEKPPASVWPTAPWSQVNVLPSNFRPNYFSDAPVYTFKSLLIPCSHLSPRLPLPDFYYFLISPSLISLPLFLNPTFFFVFCFVSLSLLFCSHGIKLLLVESAGQPGLDNAGLQGRKEAGEGAE